MTEEEINKTVVEIMRLRLFGEESRAPEQVKEILSRVYTEAINEAARTVEEFTTNEWRCPHGKEIMLTGCNLCIAVAVRRLIEGEKA